MKGSRVRLASLALAAGCFTGGLAQADPITVTYREGVNGYSMAGTGIRNGTNELNNWGTNTGYVVGWTAPTSSVTLRAIFSWSLTGIPANATVTDVTISYTKAADATSVNANSNLMLHTLTSSFSEGTQQNGTPGAANWIQRTSTLNWTTPGGDFLPAVIAQTAANPTNTSPFAFTGSGVSNPLVQAVQAAVTNQSNFMYLMKSVETLDSTRVVFQVNSDDHGTQANRPLLSITYDIIIPEPASLGLLVVMAPALMMRGRSRQGRCVPGQMV